MSSKETDTRDRAERGRQAEADLETDRRQRDRLRRLADTQPEREQGTDTPNTGGRRA